ncbi:hypothetical protein ABIE56_000964 [Luteibacter sp. 621]|uniref:hypothetical protein n=1 Tax=Luteibacter sp. 621 TaxID=3373916 RepID=UPI003D194CD1
MDPQIQPKPSNAHKPRIRIVECRETVYEIRQPDYDVVRNKAGEITAVPSGRFLRSMTCKELSTAMECAPRGAAGRPQHAIETAGRPYYGKPILDAP